MCNLHSRSTTWKNIFANNSDVEELKSKLPQNMMIGKKAIGKFNLLQLRQFNKTGIIYRLQHYYKLMVARHPFSRLVSGWKDKLTGVRRYWRNMVQKKILSEFRPGFQITRKKVGATFNEFVQYALKYKLRNRHFARQETICHPCEIKYDYIAKLESHKSDVAYIVHKKLSGHGDVNLNVHSVTGGAAMTKVLPEFANVTSKQIEMMHDKFHFDMQLFGYSIEYKNGILEAKCGDSNSTHNCC